MGLNDLTLDDVVLNYQNLENNYIKPISYSKEYRDRIKTLNFMERMMFIWLKKKLRR